MLQRVGMIALLFAGFTACNVANQPNPSTARQEGNVPVTVVNQTKYPITSLVVMNDRGEAGFDTTASELESMIGDYAGAKYPPIPPGGEETFGMKPGKKLFAATREHRKSGDPPTYTMLRDYKVDVSGPVRIVIYDGDAPKADPAPAGATQHIVLSRDEELARQQSKNEAQAQAAADANFKVCQSKLPPKQERPAPGKVHVDGKWTCILGGDAHGTNYVSLAQLADGKISATITGADRNNTWEGAVVRDELHFRLAGQDVGGKLKIDPGGRAMSGAGNSFTDRGECLSWTLTCTK